MDPIGAKFTHQKLTEADFAKAGWMTEAGRGRIANFFRGLTTVRYQVAQLDALAVEVLQSEDVEAARNALANLRIHQNIVSNFNLRIDNHQSLIEGLETHLYNLENYGTADEIYIAAHRELDALARNTRSLGSLPAILAQTRKPLLDRTAVEQASDLRELFGQLPRPNQILLRKLGALLQQISASQNTPYDGLVAQLAPSLTGGPPPSASRDEAIELDASTQLLANLTSLLQLAPQQS